MKQIFIFSTLLSFFVFSCEKTTREEPKVIVPPIYCQQSINTENMFFILPNSSKIQLEYFGEMNIEQYSAGTRIVKLTFNPKKLGIALMKVIDDVKKIYPNNNIGLWISIMQNPDAYSPVSFTEKYDKQVGAVGIDQLLSNDKNNLSFNEIIALYDPKIVYPDLFSLLKDQNYYIKITGNHWDSKIETWWMQNKITINPYCK
ncbi:hypothetical protein [Emticicia sp. SJ17W-69]|uniref:hypothetical protein n=1 Tax=Emticicia sp. SJ17W-69 TaxID=3421657 RepID=UPI003EB6F4F2